MPPGRPGIWTAIASWRGGRPSWAPPYLTLNVDGTSQLSVTLKEMLEFLPQLVPAIQEVTPLPISFDNPEVAFHVEAMKHYDRQRSQRAARF